MGLSIFLLVLGAYLISAAKASAVLVLTPKDLNAQLGHTLFLPCVVATNDSSVHVTWQYNQQSINAMPHLQVHTLMTSQQNGVTLVKSVLEVCVTGTEVAGNYSCIAATGQDTLDQETFRINVETPYIPVRIIVAPADMDGSNSSTIAVLCAAIGMPRPHITWKQNGYLINSSASREEVIVKNGSEVVVGTLTICPIRAEGGGEYTCRAQNNDSLAVEANFTVATPVSVVEHSSSAPENVNINNNHTLSCEYLGYPHPTWTFNGRLADSARFATHQTRVIRSRGRLLTTSHLSFTVHSTLFTGRYVCSGDTSHTAQFQVNVQVPAEILVQPIGPKYRLSSTVLVSCVAFGIPPPRVTWKYDGASLSNLHHTQLTEIRGVSIVASTLELCPQQETTRSGLYSCEVGNGAANYNVKSETFQLCFLKGNFGLVVSPTDRDIVAGGVYYLPCVAFSKNGESINVTWSAGGNEIEPSSSVLEERHGVHLLRSILELSCTSIENAIEYTCSATDGTEFVQESFVLHFRSLPVIKSDEERSIIKKRGGDVSFLCIVNGHPTSTVTWLKDDEPLKRDEGFIINQEMDIGEPGRTSVNNTLTLSGLTKRDEGYYACRAVNELGRVDMEEGYILSVEELIIPGAPGLRNKAVGYVSYSGSVLCIFPLLAIVIMHLASKHLRSMMETIPIVNFCIATSLLYLFYIPSSSGPWSDVKCALFSSLFHLSFLFAAFSCSNLVLLRTLRNYSKVKFAYILALLINWGLPILCLVVSLALDIGNYMDDRVCIPLGWPLWFGVLLLFAVSQVLSWIILLFSPLIIKGCLRKDIPADMVFRDALAIGSILFLFDLAWVLQVYALSTDDGSANTKNVSLQSMFVVSSALLGVISLLHFCFLQPHVRRALFQCTESSSEEIDSPKLAVSTECQVASGFIIVDKSPVGEESEVVNKLADL